MLSPVVVGGTDGCQCFDGCSSEEQRGLVVVNFTTIELVGKAVCWGQDFSSIERSRRSGAGLRIPPERLFVVSLTGEGQLLSVLYKSQNRGLCQVT